MPRLQFVLDREGNANLFDPTLPRRFPLEANKICTIGRARDNTIVLKTIIASRHHCYVKVCDGLCVVTDLESENGVYVNGTKMGKGLSRTLDVGDSMGIGISSCRFVPGPKESTEYCNEFEFRLRKVAVCARGSVSGSSNGWHPEQAANPKKVLDDSRRNHPGRSEGLVKRERTALCNGDDGGTPAKIPRLSSSLEVQPVCPENRSSDNARTPRGSVMTRATRSPVLPDVKPASSTVPATVKEECKVECVATSDRGDVEADEMSETDSASRLAAPQRDDTRVPFVLLERTPVSTAAPVTPRATLSALASEPSTCKGLATATVTASTSKGLIATTPHSVTASTPKGLTATTPHSATASSSKGLTATTPHSATASTSKGLTATTSDSSSKGLTATTPHTVAASSSMIATTPYPITVSFERGLRISYSKSVTSYTSKKSTAITPHSVTASTSNGLTATTPHLVTASTSKGLTATTSDSSSKGLVATTPCSVTASTSKALSSTIPIDYDEVISVHSTSSEEENIPLAALTRSRSMPAASSSLTASPPHSPPLPPPRTSTPPPPPPPTLAPFVAPPPPPISLEAGSPSHDADSVDMFEYGDVKPEVKPKVEWGDYTSMEDDVIVLDSDDDQTFPASQLFACSQAKASQASQRSVALSDEEDEEGDGEGEGEDEDRPSSPSDVDAEDEDSNSLDCWAMKLSQGSGERMVKKEPAEPANEAEEFDFDSDSDVFDTRQRRMSRSAPAVSSDESDNCPEDLAAKGRQSSDEGEAGSPIVRPRIRSRKRGFLTDSDSSNSNADDNLDAAEPTASTSVGAQATGAESVSYKKAILDIPASISGVKDDVGLLLDMGEPLNKDDVPLDKDDVSLEKDDAPAPIEPTSVGKRRTRSAAPVLIAAIPMPPRKGHLRGISEGEATRLYRKQGEPAPPAGKRRVSAAKAAAVSKRRKSSADLDRCKTPSKEQHGGGGNAELRAERARMLKELSERSKRERGEADAPTAKIPAKVVVKVTSHNRGALLAESIIGQTAELPRRKGSVERGGRDADDAAAGLDRGHAGLEVHPSRSVFRGSNSVPVDAPTVPISAAKPTTHQSAAKYTIPRIAAKSTTPHGAEKSAIPRSVANSTIPRSAAKSTIPHSAEKSAIPRSVAKSTIPRSAAKSTIPHSAEKSVIPRSVAKSTIPRSAEKSTIPHSAEKSAIPHSVAKSTIPHSAEKSTIPHSAEKSAIPHSVAKSTIPRSAEKSTIPHSAEKSAIPHSVAKYTIPRNSAKSTAPCISSTSRQPLVDRSGNLANLSNLLRKTCLRSSACAPKKTVRFREDDCLVNVRYIELREARPPSAPGQPPVLPPPPGGAPEYPGFFETIFNVCCWNASWLSEQLSKMDARPPPVHGSSTELRPICSRFTSYEDYVKIVRPLMLLNLWASLINDLGGSDSGSVPGQVKEMAIFSDPRKQVLTIGVSGTAPFRARAATKLALTRVDAHALLTKEETRRCLHPRVGDLVVLEMALEPENKRATSIMFAYVDSLLKRSFPNNCTSHIGLFESVENPQCQIFFTMLVKTRDCTPCFNKLMRVRVVSYIKPALRSFEAIACLQGSPLLEKILDPTVAGLTLPRVNPATFNLPTDENMLNAEQTEAIVRATEAVLSDKPNICMVQGPPGTGKSHVIVNLVLSLLSRSRLRPILLCAPSNAALDEIVTRLMAKRQSMNRKNRFNMVRCGRLDTMNPTVQPISLDQLVNKEICARKEKDNLDSVQLEINTLKAKIRKDEMALETARKNGSDTSGILRKLATWQGRIHLMERGTSVDKSAYLVTNERKDSERTILVGAHIIACTLTSCATHAMERVFLTEGRAGNFSCCIVDEASQCSEPDTLLPLMLGVKTLVLVGDPKQLPATTLCKISKKLDFGQSLLSRMNLCLDSASSPMMTVLHEQYRMHPDILCWPNREFYANRLVTPPGLDRTSRLKPYLVLKHDFQQSFNGELSNHKEAELVRGLAERVWCMTRQQGMSIGVVTPYAKQRSVIRSMLQREDWAKDVDVNTIDGFQGKERDVIIMSCVRTVGTGFMADAQRLNVALTRARYSLIVCANFSSLQNELMWRNLVEDAVQRLLIRTVKASEIRDKAALDQLITRPCR